MKDVIISNPLNMEKIKQEFVKGGKNKLHVVADFDRTLTTAFVNGKNVPSLVSTLREGNYLPEEYAKESIALYSKYHAIEISDIPLKDKKEAMKEWWQLVYGLFRKYKLNKKDLEKAVNSGSVRFRKGSHEFLDSTHSNGIPIVIISSSGLGIDSISLYLEKEKRKYSNIHIVSNTLEWDEKGYFISCKMPIIHSMNKDETSIRQFPFYERVKKRKNVILLGDNLEDVNMVNGFAYENLIKIGFFNEGNDKDLERYKNNFDVVILNDATLDYVNELLKEILKK